MTQLEFTLRCPQCGSTRFKASSPKPGPDDPVTPGPNCIAVEEQTLLAVLGEPYRQFMRTRRRLIPFIY